jgi:DNA-binding NtrC family response regulator
MGTSNLPEAHMDSLLSPFDGAVLATAPVIECAAGADACVLIIGRPSAALAIASSIHERSAHASGPFTVLDCHESGNGLAERLTRVLSSRSAGAPGTVLLREIGEMNPAEQQHLTEQLMNLRLSSNGRVQRVIASNSTPLRDRVAAGVFCERLFYRINTIAVVSDVTGLSR